MAATKGPGHTAKGLKQDRVKVAGQQAHEVSYEAK